MHLQYAGQELCYSWLLTGITDTHRFSNCPCLSSLVMQEQNFCETSNMYVKHYCQRGLVNLSMVHFYSPFEKKMFWKTLEQNNAIV